MENEVHPEQSNQSRTEKRTWVFALKQTWNDHPSRNDYLEHGITFRILQKGEMSLNDQIRRLEQENQHYGERILTLEEETIGLQKEKNTLVSQIESFKSIISEYAKQFIEKINEIALLNNIVDKLGKELNLIRNNNFLELKIDDIREKKAVLNRELMEYHKLLENVREVGLACTVAKETAPLDEEKYTGATEEASVIQSETEKEHVTIMISNTRLFKAFGFMKRRYEKLREKAEGPADYQMEAARMEFKDEISRLKEEIKILVRKNNQQDQIIVEYRERWLNFETSPTDPSKLVPIQVKSERYSNIIRKKEIIRLKQEIQDLKAALKNECEKYQELKQQVKEPI